MKIKLVLYGLFAMLLMSSCEEDPLGIFGDDIRDDMTGNWSVQENSRLFKKSTNTYQVNISKDSQDSTVILINNFYDLGSDVSVRVIMNDNILSIPSQNVNGGLIGTVTISGSGNVSWNYDKVNLSYQVDLQNSDVDNVTAVYTPLK